MKKLIIIIITLLFSVSCSSTCMEYRSATTAARSEKNLKRAEEWALKALESSECNPENDALAPYFLATEVYLKQKKYKKMAEMLSLAEKRNPDLPLENPFMLGNTPVTTIKEGVSAYREQEWMAIYNLSIDTKEKQNLEKAIDFMETAILLYPARLESYSTLAFWAIENENLEEANRNVERGLNIDDKNSNFYQLKADIIIKNKPDLKNLEEAKTLYQLAIQYSNEPGPIMRKLLMIYIELGENETAIEYSNKLLNEFPDDPDLYYNVGVLYQRLATKIYDENLEDFNNTNKDSDSHKIINLYKSYKKARKYSYNARDFYLQASDLEIEESNSLGASKEMKKLMKQIDDIFIESIMQTANEAGVELE